MQQIMQFIKQRRQQLGYSQDDLARHLGITQASYSRLESGVCSYVDTKKIDEICTFLGVRVLFSFEVVA